MKRTAAKDVRLPRPPPAEQRRWDVLGMGHGSLDLVCVIDRPPPFDGKVRARRFFRQAGGQVPTALVALRRWGWRTAWVGILGDDECGQVQESSLREEGVDISPCVRRSGASGQTAVILVDAVTGERSIAWYRPPGSRLTRQDVDPAIVEAARVVLLDGEDEEPALAMAERARRAGTAVVVDLDSPSDAAARLLGHTDVAAVSLAFAHAVTGTADPAQAARRLSALGPAVAVVTLGAGGAWATARGVDFYVPAFRVLAADTTSAGDLFHAGLIHSLLQESDAVSAVRLAAAAAALECTRLGGRAAIPDLEAVQVLAASGEHPPSGRRAGRAAARRGLEPRPPMLTESGGTATQRPAGIGRERASARHPRKRR